MRNTRKFIKKQHASFSRIAWFLLFTLLISGCTVPGLGDIDIIKTAETIEKVAKSFQDISPEQEYYIGRAFGATVAGQYAVYDNPQATSYLNLLGQTLAQASDRPETFGGYHFAILNSDEINAFAAPGGLIFVTRGILRCTQNEDALAAVLAHEIGHVQHKHGLQAIKKSRASSALTTIALEEVQANTSGAISNLTSVFQDSITDMTTTIINNGYSRAFEREADQAAIIIMKRVGYDPNGLIEMLRVMEARLNPAGQDFAKTHPSPASRIKEIQKIIGAYTEVKTPKARQKRFETAIGKI
ncbi:peptidase M48, Ste24p [Candidatus Vecturithrix granuli]|uniref:Peptidase M48, Ste24p n=1 Tax=Vecturithrix granuli TaxID=1499967 RepID=A0A081C4S6_VECG1|nr:peptidase M48, Ste24p [Candidatus Vecturithrix granuli]